MRKKRIPVGYEDIRQIIDEGFYFVDKTLLIQEILDIRGKVNLLTRPRRFGKTLNLSMLQRFFEDERTEEGEKIDNRYIFNDLAISRAGEEYLAYQQRYPVISLSLKSAKQPDFDMAYESLIEEIRREYQRHIYVLEGKLPKWERKHYENILSGEARPAIYAQSLKILSSCLSRYHGEKAIILIDEYDVPLENSFFAGFYEPMVGFARSLFETALKTNDSLEFAVVTGCLRISRESIFTGLNNLEIHSLLSPHYASRFGFTEDEVKEMLAYYGLSDKLPELERWYDGYRIGGMEIYNPWSIINYVKTALGGQEEFPRPYWSNTSANSIVRELVERADEEARGELEELIARGTIEKPVHEDITYGEMFKSQDNLWNFLYFTGYLKEVSRRLEENQIYLTMAVPNEEIRYIYQNTIREWLENALGQTDFAPLYQALRTQDTGRMEEFINSQLECSISYYDEAERFYHGYLLGILGGMGGYRLLSNREQGTGRPDILLRPHNPVNPAILIEPKHVKKFSQRSEACDEALEQIRAKRYAAELFEEGYEKVVCYGMAFCQKACLVKTELSQW